MENLRLTKSIWTEDDFDQMGWHDNRIYGIAFGMKESEIIFDIDYILEWTEAAEEEETNFKFQIAPSTLVFRNVYDFYISSSIISDMKIEDIYRSKPARPKNAAYVKEQIEYEWTIETTSGEITFISVGYKQILRKAPVLQSTQQIDLLQRGGISFDLKSFFPE